MSAEELFNNNINLAYKFATKFYNYYDYDEARQIALLGLWKACRAYNPEKGVALSTFAYKIMSNEFYMEDRRMNGKIKKNNIRLISLEYTLDEDERLEILDTIAESDTPEDDIIDKIDYEQICKQVPNLNEREFKVFTMVQKGYRQSEIARLMECSQPQVSRLYRNSINKLRNWIN